mmetsp:Transcript_46894/g.108429  ORF Transcript_46894/g.108429 Transcript_46894/m.108429 type:complete len:89 (-) Transcript_46894:806-1072(-)
MNRPNDHTLSKPQTLEIVFCQRKDIPEVTKQQRLMAMAVQSHSRCCTQVTKLCQTPPDLSPLCVGLQDGSSAVQEQKASCMRKCAQSG